MKLDHTDPAIQRGHKSAQSLYPMHDCEKCGKTDYEQLAHLIAKETRAFQKRIAELTQERDAALADRDEARELARSYHRAWKKKRLISTDFPEDRYPWLKALEAE